MVLNLNSIHARDLAARRAEWMKFFADRCWLSLASDDMLESHASVNKIRDDAP